MWNKIRCAVFEPDIRRRAAAYAILEHGRINHVAGERSKRPV